MQAAIFLPARWREPAAVLGGLADRAWALGLLSADAPEGWSYVAAEPDATLTVGAQDPRDPFEAIAALAGPAIEPAAEGPPFQGGVAGLLSYDLADRIEALNLARLGDWPDVACARYSALLAFDHARRQAIAVGRGHTRAAAEAQARRALAWLDLPERPARPLAAGLIPDAACAYEQAVAEVVERIRAGEIFQANIARRWRGRLPPGGHPADLLARLSAASPAPFAAYLRLPDRAVVSNSPERFLRVDRRATGLVAETQPIKGTISRGADADEDRALADQLAASVKDRAENLMIVDLMRNDLARVCTPGSVAVPDLFRIATYANVHHLVSTVTGRLAPGRGALDLLRAAFPPGSITGAPKVQAMKVIAALEPPRGPFFGSMFRLGLDGGLDSSVLIRTAALVQDAAGWEVEVRAGAGIVADSRPLAERLETETKISALASALGGLNS